MNNKFEHYLNLVKEGKTNEPAAVNELRHVTVEYSDGSKIDTSINGTDDEIRDYFKSGKQFNLGNGPVDGDGNYGDNIQTVVGVVINESVTNESMTKADLINILGKYTNYLFQNNYINYIFKQEETDKIVAEFMGIGESMVNESSYNINVVTVPPTKEWFKTESPMDGSKYDAFTYNDKTWAIRDKDVALFRANVGKDVKFRYIKNSRPLFMEFPTPVEDRKISLLGPMISYEYKLSKQPDRTLTGTARKGDSETSIKASIEEFMRDKVLDFKFNESVMNESTAYMCDNCGERAEHEEIEDNPNMKCGNCGDSDWVKEH